MSSFLSHTLEVLHVCVLEGSESLLGGDLGSAKHILSLLHWFEFPCWLVCNVGELLERDLCYVCHKKGRIKALTEN